MPLAHHLHRWFTRPTGRPRPPGRRLGVEALEARDNPSGGLLDPTFGTSGVVVNNFSRSEKIADVEVQADGKILTAGYVYNSSTGDDSAVARYNPDGTRDASFGSGGLVTIAMSRGSDSAMAVAPQPGTANKILVAGSLGDFGVVRLNPNGTADTTFGPKGSKGQVTVDFGGTESLNTMAVLPDGRFVLAGTQVQPTSTSYGYIILARFNADGTLDTTFGNKGKVVSNILVYNRTHAADHAVNVAVDGLGRVVVSGMTTGASTRDFLVARFTAAGAPDTSFGAAHTGVVTRDILSGSSDWAKALTLQGDGGVVVAGWAVPPVGVQSDSVALVRLKSDGTFDPAFGTGGVATVTLPPGQYSVSSAEVQAAALQADGRIVVAGRVVYLTPNGDGTYQTSPTDLLTMRFNPDGSPDASYGPAGTGVVGTRIPPVDNAYGNAVAIQPDGRVVVAGFQTTLTGTTTEDVVLARYLPSAPSPTPVQVGSFASSSAAVAAGAPLTLTAGGITDATTGATVTKVAFYAVDATGAELFLGYGTKNADGTWSLTVAADLAPGSYTLLALAVDSTGAVSDPLTLTLQVL